MDFEKEETGRSSPDWRKDTSGDKKDFDFDAFLQDDLEDRITAALDGKDLLEPDAFGESVANYTPRRAANGERGRHEAPEPVSTAQFVAETPEAEPEKKAAEPSDPRYAAPERPRVVVAEPRPTVFVTPPNGGEDEPATEEKNPRRGLIWTIVILAVVAVAVGCLLAVLRSGGRSNGRTDVTPAPISQSETTPTPADDATPAPTETPAEATPTPSAPPQVTTYHVTVTAGSGGKVSPSGAVSVEKGGTVTFTITPDAGYELSQLLLDGSAIELTDTVRIANVAGDHTLYAVFQASATPTPEPTPTPTPEPTNTPEPTPEPTAPPAPDGGDPVDMEPTEP